MTMADVTLRRHSTTAVPVRAALVVSEHELFWIEVIRQAARNTDSGPTLDRVQKLRAIFRN